MQLTMRIHITGIAGTAMGSLAGLLKSLGHEIRGSDLNFYPPMGPALESWGIELLQGFQQKWIAEEASQLDAVVIGNVCRRDNPEALAADQLGLPKLHIADALKRYALPNTSPLVVAGTHGKTTTSSLVAYLLKAAGLEPGYLIGGLPQDGAQSFHAAPHAPQSSGSSRQTPFVLEGDEYDTAYWEKTPKFIHYQAEVAIITSIEHDHIDIYPTLASYLNAFQSFIKTLPKTGLLVAYAGDAHIRELAVQSAAPTLYYALEGDDTGSLVADYQGKLKQTSADGLEFTLFYQGKDLGNFKTPLSGLHNLRNSIAALVAAHRGFSLELSALSQALRSFQGIKRRQELLAEPNDIRVFDDFAHHPTAVGTTLAGLKSSFPQGKLFALFEPRSATACRKIHQKAYLNAFKAADHVLLAPIGRPELGESERLEISELVQGLQSAYCQAHGPLNLSEMVAYVVKMARPGDSIVIMSNGAFGGIHQKMIDALLPD